MTLIGILVYFIFTLVTLAGLLVAGLYIFIKRQYRYWTNRNIPHAKPWFPFGNFGAVGSTQTIGDVLKELYDQGEGHSLYGVWVLHKPVLVVRDLDLIKNILIRDFMYFHDHDMYYNEDDDPLSAHLAALDGVKWRNLRAKLTPTFTSGKMKMMFPMVVECGKDLRHVLGTIADAEGVFEAKEILARFSTDVISTCAFGIEANSLKEPDSLFRKMGRKIFDPTWSIMLRNLASSLVPDLAALLKMTVIPKDVSKFFLEVVRDTMNYRQQNNVTRKDFMQLLMQLKTKGFIDDVNDRGREMTDNDKFTLEQAAAQAFVFFIGGFETSATLMQFMLYELALNPEIQDAARKEVRSTLDQHNGLMNYEALHSMEYMTKVIKETLRKYPPAPGLNRVCTKDYRVPGSDFIIEKGTQVMIASYGIQMDPQYFPEPDKFDPERFNEENKAAMHSCAFIPFGDGPRHCIGQRFAQMQIRVGLTAILAKYRVEVCQQTSIPMVLDPKSFLFTPKSGMHLKVTHL